MRPAPPQVGQAFGLRAGLGAGARAGLAGHRGRNADLGGLARIGLLEADLHVVAQVGAALAAGAGARARHAEDAFEQIGEGRAEFRAEAARPRTGAMLEGRVTVTVIGRALVAILEDLVGLVDLLEAELAAGIARIAVGMPLHRELAERGLELTVVHGPLDLQHFVVAAFGHTRSHPHPACGSLASRIYPFAHRTSKKFTPGR